VQIDPLTISPIAFMAHQEVQFLMCLVCFFCCFVFLLPLKHFSRSSWSLFKSFPFRGPTRRLLDTWYLSVTCFFSPFFQSSALWPSAGPTIGATRTWTTIRMSVSRANRVYSPKLVNQRHSGSLARDCQVFCIHIWQARAIQKCSVISICVHAFGSSLVKLGQIVVYANWTWIMINAHRHLGTFLRKLNFCLEFLIDKTAFNYFNFDLWGLKFK